jgi:DNA-binding transcriptional MerR regulator
MDKSPDAFRTISEVAEDLKVPQHVLRFWETRFAQIKPLKRGGGRRYYRPDDVDLLRGIRHLLYGEGYTIRGVQRILKEEGLRFVQSVGRGDARAPAPSQARPNDAAKHRAAEEQAAEDDAAEDDSADDKNKGADGDDAEDDEADGDDAEDEGVEEDDADDEAAEEDDDSEDDGSEDDGAEDDHEHDEEPVAATPLGDPRTSQPRSFVAPAVDKVGARGTHDAAIAKGDLERLKAALAELTECERVLSALKAPADAGAQDEA